MRTGAINVSVAVAIVAFRDAGSLSLGRKAKSNVHT